MKVSAHDVFSLSAACVAATANYYMSNERLVTHAAITSLGSVLSALLSYLELLNISKKYSADNYPFKNTLGISDGRHMGTTLPVIYAILNTLLIGVYVVTWVYESEK